MKAKFNRISRDQQKRKCRSISSSRLFTHLNTCYIYIHRALIFFKSFFIWTNWFFKQLKCYTPKLYFMLWKCKNIFFLFEQSPIESSNLVRLWDLGLRSRLEETQSSVFRLANCIKKRFQKHKIVFEMLVKKSLSLLPQGRSLFLGNWSKKIRWFKNF